MEAHLVHKNAQGDLAVLGVMIMAGDENAFLAKFWDKLPEQAGEPQTHGDVMVNVGDLLPEDRTSFRYSGSLTTPPCSEGVRWTVLQTPISASEAQIAKLQGITGKNARPVQPLNGRTLQVVR
jgi:carbonic anhydrase